MLYETPNITSIDDESEAIAALEKRRCIPPKVYCERKKIRAQKINECAENNDVHFDGNADSVAEDEEKIATRMIVLEKVSAMHGQFIDLTGEEIENIQDILETSDDELDPQLDQSNGAAAIEAIQLAPTPMAADHQYDDVDIISIVTDRPLLATPVSSKVEHTKNLSSNSIDETQIEEIGHSQDMLEVNDGKLDRQLDEYNGAAAGEAIQSPMTPMAANQYDDVDNIPIAMDHPRLATPVSSTIEHTENSSSNPTDETQTEEIGDTQDKLETSDDGLEQSNDVVQSDAHASGESMFFFGQNFVPPDSSFAFAQKGSVESIFIPPTRSVPDYYRLLDPGLFRRLSRSVDAGSADYGVQDQYDGNMNNEATALQQMFSVMHLHFPGQYVQVKILYLF